MRILPNRGVAVVALAFLAGVAGCAHDMPQPAAPADAEAAMTADDPYLWLEDIHGERALAWVEARNAETAQAFTGTPAFESMRTRILEVLDSDARIPAVDKIGELYYNFWKDQAHPLGIWRRTTLAEYRKQEPAWETVIDLDALSAADGTRWVWHGAQCLKPAERLCLVALSPGGGDAQVVREFDLADKAFVAGGFELPVAKSEVAWIDADHLYVGTDFGPGSMTTSSYPRTVRVWSRGTPLADAREVFSVAADDLAASGRRDLTPGFERDFLVRTIDFFSSETFLRRGDGQVKIDVPLDAVVDVHREWLLVAPRSEWRVGDRSYPGGSLLAAPFDDYMAGKRDLVVLFTPGETTSLAGTTWTRNHLILTVLDDVSSRLEVLTPAASGDWARTPLAGAPALSQVEAEGIDPDESDAWFMTVTGFLTPTTLEYGEIGGAAPAPIKQTPAFFDASPYAVTQHFVRSKDGTRVPYFQIAPKDLVLDGSHPTVLNGYGGFEVARLPSYSGTIGRAWLEQGGVFVVANIRGGGEYGPRWHQAALKANRPRAYEDFAAVARDLVRRGVTSRERLGATGGSNGGLLVGNMLTHYPELFGAIVCQVPLLDMKRYTHLSAGASWIAEYGDPDKPEEWAFIRTFSPYHNVERGRDYPPVLFYTATSDDRVGPVQARKMAARMREMGYPQAWFYENTEGGHGGAADNRQSAFMQAMTYTFLARELGLGTGT